jgi:hypothetical protein
MFNQASRPSRFINAPILGFLLVFSYSISVLADTELTGRDIMDEVSQRHDVDSRFELNEMILIDKSGNETRRKMRSYLRTQKNGLSKSLLIFDFPKGISGVACLTWERTGNNDDQWTFLPAMGNQLKRISSGGKSGSGERKKGGRTNYWMGTDYTFEDLLPEKRENFRYERMGDSTWHDVPAFVIETFPASEEISTGYQKRTLTITKSNFFIVQIEYFALRSGKLLKTLSLSGVQPIFQDTWGAKQSLMDNHQRRSKTIIHYLEQDFDPGAFPNKVFSHRFIESKKHMRR